jgi:hypothetical protein
MIGQWFAKRRADRRQAELAEAVRKVLGRYAELVEKHFGAVMDESWLPLSKNDMKHTLMIAIAQNHDGKLREWLKTCWIMLADFQPGIGNDPLSMPHLPEEFDEAKTPEFKKSFAQWREVFDRVQCERQQCMTEMLEFVSGLSQLE